MQDPAARPGSTDGLARNPFDRALELRALADAADAYAAQRGEPGSASYRTAWLTFRNRFQSLEELKRWRTAAAGRRTHARQPTAAKRDRTPHPT